MSEKSHKTEITVAIIGLIGVLGGAVFANWDKIFPAQSPTNPPPTISSTPQPSKTKVDSNPNNSTDIKRSIDVPKPIPSPTDYQNVQAIYEKLKDLNDCEKITELARRLNSYSSNPNLVPHEKRDTIKYPTTKQQPTIGDLAQDRYFRIKMSKHACFEK